MYDKFAKYVKCPKCGKKMHPRALKVHTATCKKESKEKPLEKKSLEDYSYNELKKYIKDNMEETPDGYTRMKKEELFEIAKGL